MNILVTGGTGFIGSHLLHKLVSLSHKVFTIKRSSSDLWRIKDVEDKLTIFIADDYENLANIFRTNSFDLIIHLATHYIKHHQGWSDIESMNNTNITFPSVLLDLAISHKVKYFINTGTCFEYKISQKPVNELSEIEPYNYYASTKVGFEDILKFFVNKNHIQGLTLKLFYPYGEMDNQKIIPLMINAMITNSTLKVTYGEQELNFTYVGDIVDAYIKAIDFIENGTSKKYEVFNIGNNKTSTIKQIGNLLEEISHKKNIISFSKPYSLDEIMHMSCDIKKAKKLLNWSPKTDIIKGLKNCYSFYQQD